MAMPIWVQLFLLLCLATAAYAGVSSAPFVPTRKKELSSLLARVPRSSHDTIIDLGSGTGTLLFAFADAGHRGPLIGYEISLIPFFISLTRKWLRPYKYRHISLRYQSLWRAELSEANIVLCFLLPSAYERLTPWLRKQLQRQSRVIVQAWPLPQWPAEKICAPLTLPWFVHEVQ